jgi:protein O-GlcNAc transferase
VTTSHLDSLAQSVRLSPERAEAWQELGLALDDAGELDAATRCLERATDLEPKRFVAHRRLAFIWVKRGEPERAARHYQSALALDGAQPEVVLELAAVKRALGRTDDAIVLYRKVLQLDDRRNEVRTDLGTALYEQGKLDAALEVYAEAVAREPSNAQAYANLGNVQKELALHVEAERSYRRAIELAPDDATIHGNLLFALSYHPDYGPERLLAEARRYGARHTEPLSSQRKPPTNVVVPERKLRIGYVSADFREHVSMFYLDALLRHHDRSAFDVCGYSSVFPPDAWTARYSGHCSIFRNLYGLDDAAAAELIRRDGVDILVDLSLHSSRSRQGLFALKPAPLQVSWLAYVGTTGNDAMDYRLTDPQLDPLGITPAYTERSFWLPATFWCYEPQGGELAVGALPALSNGHVTFGCLGNFCKLNDGVLELWARVLGALPGSRLLLHAPEGGARERVLGVLERNKVERARFDFAGRVKHSHYLQSYGRVDVCLDTLPYNGLTNSLDAAWMGVPTVTLAGPTVTGRAGSSVAHNLGLPQLAATSPDGFVAAAVALASDLSSLAELRRNLRRRLEESPLTDQPRFARDIEGAYRKMWREWCAAQTSGALTL